MKKVLNLLLMFLLMFSFQVNIVSANSNDESESTPKFTFELVSITTEESEIGVRSLQETFTTETYTHNIYDSNNILIGTFVTNVEGWYDRYEGWSTISNISAHFTYKKLSSLTLSTSRSGSNGYTYIYLSGIQISKVTYHLSSTGRWSNY